MRKAQFFIVVFICSIFVEASNPWQNITESNMYWASLFGIEPSEPQAVITEPSTSVLEIKPDPAIRLLNAAIRYQIDNNLESKELVRFSDSMMHVMMYLSGGSPAMPDQFNRAGWWRLSYPVAMRYGLLINEDIDERFDFKKSTVAAMNYAKDLHEQYKDGRWLLAFVNAPVEANRVGAQHEEKNLYKSLASLYKLMVSSNYSAAEEYAVEHFYGSVKYFKNDDIMLADLVIEKTGIPENIFLALNPQFRSNKIPSKSKINLTELALENLRKSEEDVVLLSQVRIEDRDADLALARNRIVKNQPDPRSTSSSYYSVRRGDNLGLIADRYGVRISDLKSWNNLRGSMIYVGQKLIVYSPKRKPVNVASAPTATKQHSPTQPPKSKAGFKAGEFITYKVKSGDTLYSIAQQFPGVSADNLMAWNSISPNIKVGQKIKVPKSEIRDYTSSKYPDNL